MWWVVDRDSGTVSNGNPCKLRVPISVALVFAISSPCAHVTHLAEVGNGLTRP